MPKNNKCKLNEHDSCSSEIYLIKYEYLMKQISL